MAKLRGPVWGAADALPRSPANIRREISEKKKGVREFIDLDDYGGVLSRDWKETGRGKD